MPAMPVPVAGERQSLLEYLLFQQSAFHAVSLGLTDEQARRSPTVSTLCIGGLIKHVTTMQYAWTQLVEVGTSPPDDPRSLVGMMADHSDQFRFHAHECLVDLLADFTAQCAETLRVFAAADLAATIAVPRHIDLIYDDAHWTVRWVLLHLVDDIARHAGHADIIRESIDGATMYQLLGALEGWSAQRRARAAQP